jgi:hypothetical protein
VSSQLATVAKLKDALSDFQGRAVHFIEEESNRLVAGPREPVRRAERGHVAVSLRKTQKVALGHLASSPLDHRKTDGISELINDAGLANAVPSSEEDRVVCVRDVRKDGQKGLEIDCHVLCSPVGLSALPLSYYA